MLSSPNETSRDIEFAESTRARNVKARNLTYLLSTQPRHTPSAGTDSAFRNFASTIEYHQALGTHARFRERGPYTDNHHAYDPNTRDALDYENVIAPPQRPKPINSAHCWDSQNSSRPAWSHQSQSWKNFKKQPLGVHWQYSAEPETYKRARRHNPFAAGVLPRSNLESADRLASGLPQSC